MGGSANTVSKNVPRKCQPSSTAGLSFAPGPEASKQPALAQIIIGGCSVLNEASPSGDAGNIHISTDRLRKPDSTWHWQGIVYANSESPTMGIPARPEDTKLGKAHQASLKPRLGAKVHCHTSWLTTFKATLTWMGHVEQHRDSGSSPLSREEGLPVDSPLGNAGAAQLPLVRIPAQIWRWGRRASVGSLVIHKVSAGGQLGFQCLQAKTRANSADREIKCGPYRLMSNES